PLAGEPLEWPPLPPASDFDLSTRDIPLLAGVPMFEESMPGSNNFAVTGALAAFTDGAALVANDMHLTLRVPNLWFRTRLITLPKNQRLARQTDITGITLPGVPAMIIGSNRHIAWSFTNSYGDFSDWVRVTFDPDDRSRYLGVSGWQSVQTFPETIHVRNAPAKVITVRETEWGPIAARDHDGAPLAIAWTAFQPGGVNLNLVELEHAQTADEAAVIAQQTGMPAQNFIVGDKQGNILWTIAGRIPLRSDNFDPRLPADWSVPGVGWLGWLNPTEYPLIRNPDSGRLWTANTRTVNADTLPIIGDGGYDLGARSKQIRDNLFALERFTADDLFAIQRDHRALFFMHWHALLLDTLNYSGQTRISRQLEQVLKHWDGRAAA
ncbi:MAG TPA: penicillin acylase family protein, partial [Nitrosomonas sp.]|nr:penicillin acylase family protein [Nitrosomonas sp.]